VLGGVSGKDSLPWLDQFCKLEGCKRPCISLPLNNSLHMFNPAIRYCKCFPFLFLLVLNIVSICGYDIVGKSNYNFLLRAQTRFGPYLSTMVT
jgi:hypothetical protein